MLIISNSFDTQNLAGFFSLKWLGDLNEAKKTDVAFAGGFRTTRPRERSFFLCSCRSSKYHIKKQKNITFCNVTQSFSHPGADNDSIGAFQTAVFWASVPQEVTG